MKKYFLSLLSLALLLTACDPGKGQFTVDNTQPVSPENRVIYQLNVGAFTPEGTFKAAQEQLGRLDTLGIDILWLMPVYPRGATMHSPYASMDFQAVNPDYGTVADLKAFVAAAHERGMKVWLDWVPNHVAVENPWVMEHPEYLTKDAKGQMIHPHGWGDVYELNYQDEGLVNAMNSALRFWTEECDVDGFRCDYVSSPTIPVSYWQNIIAELKSKSPQRPVEFLSETDISNPENIRIDSCGFDYDYAWDLQGELAWKFKDSHSADSLKMILVSVELNAVVERMCSSRNKETADRIAAIALKSRLMMQQGMPHNTRKTTSGLPLPATISVSASRQVTNSQTAH